MATAKELFPDWLRQPWPAERPTEILLPVTVGVAPMVSHLEDRNGWSAVLYVIGREFWDCPHCHSTQDEAWECAQAGALEMANEAIGRRGRLSRD